MENDANKISELHDRLDAMAIKQGLLADEILRLTKELGQLKTASPDAPEKTPLFVEKAIPKGPDREAAPVETALPKKSPTPVLVNNLSRDLEEVIGGSLINKIGMAAILIGMGIGIKYVIDHDLISPLVRILMGYLVGALLLVISFLYNKFRDVLFGGEN